VKRQARQGAGGHHQQFRLAGDHALNRTHDGRIELERRIEIERFRRSIRRRIEQAEAQLAELAQLFGQQTIGRQEWLAARPPIEQRLTLAKKRLTVLNRTAALTPHIGDASALRERWRDLSLTKQAQIVEAVLDHVVVGPGRRGYNRFDSNRLSPVWRA